MAFEHINLPCDKTCPRKYEHGLASETPVRDAFKEFCRLLCRHARIAVLAASVAIVGFTAFNYHVYQLSRIFNSATPPQHGLYLLLQEEPTIGDKFTRAFVRAGWLGEKAGKRNAADQPIAVEDVSDRKKFQAGYTFFDNSLK